MKPDKIYVRVGTLSSNGSAEEYVLPEWYEMPHIGRIEYIRKDIVDETIKTAEDHAYFAGQEKFREKLIEWAKEKLEDLKGLLDTDPYKEVYIGQCEILKDMMNKWNLM